MEAVKPLLLPAINASSLPGLQPKIAQPCLLVRLNPVPQGISVFPWVFCTCTCPAQGSSLQSPTAVSGHAVQMWNVDLLSILKQQ
jgi:hypothetical protein